MEYNPDIFFKELTFPGFSQQALSRATLPEITNDERRRTEAPVGPLKHARRTIVDTSEGIVKSAFFKHKNINDQIFINHATNLLQLGKSDFIRIMIQWIWGSSTSTPHTDNGRSSQLLYITDPGGTNVETHWFIEPGQPLIRTWTLELTGMNDTRHLKKIFTAVLKPNTWYYFNTAIIHSVTNMESDRVGFSVVSDDIMSLGTTANPSFAPKINGLIVY